MIAAATTDDDDVVLVVNWFCNEIVFVIIVSILVMQAVEVLFCVMKYNNSCHYHSNRNLMQYAFLSYQLHVP